MCTRIELENSEIQQNKNARPSDFRSERFVPREKQIASEAQPTESLAMV